MEPVTHFMTGACLARTGFNRKTAYATLAMTIAAEAPDIDTLWSIDGPIASFQHHRGWTHTLLGAPILTSVIVGLLWLFHRWRRGRSMHTESELRVRWGLLWFAVLLANLSHLLLDFTNNYGIRPFFPFNPHWYAGSIVFIFEPVIFFALLLGLVMPALFALTNSEIGAQQTSDGRRGWALFALLIMLGTWGWRTWEQQNAETLLRHELAASDNPAPILKLSLSPYPINPFRWHAVAETPTYFQLATVDLLNHTVTTDPQAGILFKPASTLATLAAKRSWLGHAYLDWSQFPLVQDVGPGIVPDGPNAGQTATIVTFSDLRFAYDVPFLHGRAKNPLGATAYVDGNNRVIAQQVGDRIQR